MRFKLISFLILFILLSGNLFAQEKSAWDIFLAKVRNFGRSQNKTVERPFQKGYKLEIPDGNGKFVLQDSPERFCNGKEVEFDQKMNKIQAISEKRRLGDFEKTTYFKFDGNGLNVNYVSGVILNHEEIASLKNWTRLFPIHLRKNLNIEVDGYFDVGMSVYKTPQSVSIVLAKSSLSNQSFDRLYWTIHELGHIISLKNSVDLGKTECESSNGVYNKDKNSSKFLCSLRDSVFAVFQTHFSSLRESCPDWANLVSKYSCESNDEDFAEHWVNWVLDNDVEDEKPDVMFKYNFFERYPELVKYKKEIRALLPGSVYCKK